MQDRIKDISETLVNMAEDNRFDMRQYEECEQRIALIRSLKRKYGNSVDEINSYLEDIREEYEFLSDGEEKVKEYEEEKHNLLDKLYKSSALLLDERKKTAEKLAGNVLKELKELGMPSCKFQTEFSQLPSIDNFHPDPNGGVDAIFMFSAKRRTTGKRTLQSNFRRRIIPIYACNEKDYCEFRWNIYDGI